MGAVAASNAIASEGARAQDGGMNLSRRRLLEGAVAAGASRFQVIMHSVLPQVLPQLADITIYRWEYHFRASAVLGIVGAGGIGFELMAALRLIKYDEVSAILLSILACVIVVDSIGTTLRRHLK